MRLFPHRPHSLTLALASAALAAAVLLTGCGGDGGGNGGGGGTTPAPNPGTTTPTQPEQPSQPDQPEEPETPEETDQKEVAAPGETVTTGGAEMKVEKADITAKVEKADDNTAYAPFTFSIKNTSDAPIDLQETLTAQQKARSAIAVFALETPNESSLAEAFGKGVPSDHLTVTLNGEPVQARAAIQVYDEAKIKQEGTILKEKGWYAEFNVVAQVGADWVEADEPLKVEYNLPAADSTQELKASFAVTSTGEAPLRFTPVGSSNLAIYDDFRIVTRQVKIVNRSSTGTADLSGFLSGQEVEAMGKELSQRSKELLNSCTDYASLQKANTKMVQEIYTGSTYTCKAVALKSASGKASCVAMVDDENGQKRDSLNPGESVTVTINIYLPVRENVTVWYKGQEMLWITGNDYDNKDGIDMSGEQYTTQPTATLMSITSQKDTQNGQSGYLIWAKMRVVNSTNGTWDIHNTLGTCGMTPNTIAAEKVKNRTQASHYTATVILNTNQQYEKWPIVTVKETGMDPVMKKGEIDTVYLFTFVPSGAEANWLAIKYYQDGSILTRIENPDLPEESDLGHGKVFEDVSSSDQALDNIAEYKGIQVSLDGYATGSNYEEENYTYIAVRLSINNSSKNIYLPTEHSDYRNDGPTPVDVATSGKYASKYVAFDMGGGSYQYGVITSIHHGSGSSVAPGDQASIQVVIRVPKDWKEIILKYTLPVDGGTKYARFRVRNNGGITSDSGSSGTTETEEDLQWYAPSASDVWSWEVKSMKLYVVLSNCEVKNNGTEAVSFDNAITKTDFEQKLNAQRNGLRNSEEYKDMDEDELTAKAISDIFLLNPEYQVPLVRARVSDANYYSTMLIVDKKILEPGERASVSILVCPTSDYTSLQYYYKNTPIGNTIVFGQQTAVQAFLSRAGELLRAVK